MSKSSEEFLNWVNRNRYGNYGGIVITPQTKLVSYTYVISVGVLTFRRSTRYYFRDAERKEATCAMLACILCNLTLGWWGIPWGPIWTIQETICDLADSHTMCWGEIAGGTPGEPISIKDDKACTIPHI